MSMWEKYPNGIVAYDKARLDAVLFFPKGDVKCRYCKLCIYDRNRGGYMCAITDEILYAKDKGVGVNCPLESEE